MTRLINDLLESSTYAAAPQVDLYNEDFIYRPGPRVCSSRIRYHADGILVDKFKEVHLHQTGPLDAPIQIHAVGERSPAYSEYHLFSLRGDTCIFETVGDNIHLHVKPMAVLKFQTGPLREIGVDGVTDTALLAVLIDRLDDLQESEYACADNEEARTHLASAMAILQRRSRKRLERGLK